MKTEFGQEQVKRVMVGNDERTSACALDLQGDTTIQI